MREEAPVAIVIPLNRNHKMSAPDLTWDLDLSTEQLHSLLDLTGEIKRRPRMFNRTLTGKSIALLFEKPSLRTRFTFELAIKQMGGDSVAMEGRIGLREPIKDMARNLERWVDAIIARTFAQSTVNDLARWSSVPVINALSDLYHPCQALADVFTLKEHFQQLKGLNLAFVGDGNNVAHSLMLSATRLGMNFAIATPVGYEPDPTVLAEAQRLSAATGAKFSISHDAARAVTNADAVYTDVWTSMGQETEAAERRRTFIDYQVTGDLLDLAGPDCVFMHCLPAKRGEEVSDEVIEGNCSIVFDQAENRLHAQKALLSMLLG
jgi:ornithine carbamoyltransferase